MRRALVLWHRWVGLAMALFLILAGLTGAVITFEEEIDSWLNPKLLRPAWQAGVAAMNVYSLREKAQQQAPAGTFVDELVFDVTPGHAAMFRLTSSAQAASADQLFIHPQTGELLGMRLYGDSLFQRETMLGFLFRLHYSLALPGITGHLIFGVVAVLWTLDCFIAFWLTLPRKQKHARSGFISRWKPSWLVKWQASATRINFDLHRAFGLWLCTVLLIFAWSSVMFNLREQVYMPVMSTFLKFDTSWRNVPRLPQPLTSPFISWPDSHTMARKAMQHFAREHQLQLGVEKQLRLGRQRGVYAYMVHSSADLNDTRSNTAILVDAQTGEIKGWWLPTQGEAGNTVSNWLGALHMGHVFGFPYRVFVCLTGMSLCLISMTGVLIWLKKQSGRQHLRR
jgi:uncharacterized iron-regulated membrane protein